MNGHIVDFTATGTPRALAQAIEDYAKGRGAVSVLLVPWESDTVTLSLSVTLVESEGWAIEHTNLGTVKLTDLSQNRTQIALEAHAMTHAEQERLNALLDQFGRQIQNRFQAEAGASTP